MPSATSLDDCEGEFCRAEDCEESLADGEGWDGYCGNHADVIYGHEEGDHKASADGPHDECPLCA